MKITFILWDISFKGGTRVLLNVVNGLAQRKHNVSMVTLSGESWLPMRIEVKYRSKVPVNWKPLFLIDMFNLSRKLPDSDITIATFFPTAYSAFIGGKGLLLYYIQHYEPLLYSDPLIRLWAHLSYRLPLNWIVNSTWVRNVLKRKFNRNGFLVNPGINQNLFYPREVEKEKNVKKILCLGRSNPVKGLQDAFQAMRIVYKKRPDTKLVLYGSEPHLKSISPVPCEYIYKPDDEELAKLYSSTDVAILPSWYESFPLPPLEAMACGTPVVTTRYGTEDYAINEANSLVVPPREPKALAHAVLRVLSDEGLAERLRKAGLQTAGKFTWDRTVDTLERIFLKFTS